MTSRSEFFTIDAKGVAAVRNLEIEKATRVSTFRKIAIGSWKTVGDPSVYGTMELTMDKALEYIAQFREQTGIRLTVSHLMAKAAGHAIVEVPEINSILRFNRIYRRKTIGIFFQVVMKDANGEIDLSGTTVYDVQHKDMPTIVREFEEKVTLVRERKDPNLEKTRGIFKHVPYLFMNAMMNVIGFLAYTLNLKLPGTARDPFGSMLITNVGSLGIDQAYVPLVPYSRVPIILAIGATNKVPVVEDDEVVIRQRLKVNATFDHRFIDGAHIAKMAEVFRRCFSDPETHFGPIPTTHGALDVPSE
tara:strand:+ start:1418 stop:2329 length:912 start_codon:yes stop_codon:yes gene_type:complete